MCITEQSGRKKGTKIQENKNEPAQELLES